MNKLAAKYLRPSQIPTKACHGCGIGMIENWLLQAIDELGLKQEDVIFGTGIGCVGRQTFATWGGDNFGATHGRALAVATGLKLAQPDKTYLIVVGDGDAASIGTSHLIHAARRNLGVTVICEDNMGYESTGGQFSPTTPAGYVTNSSPYGMVEPGFDPCDVVKAAGATFVAETTATQWHQTVKIVKKALQNDGFSFVHVRFPCNENFGAYALGTRDTLKNLEWIYEHTQGRKSDGSETDFVWETGIKHDASNSRPEFSKIMRDMNARVKADMEAKKTLTVTPTKTRTEILISGFGGQGVVRMGQILGLCAINQGHRVTMLKSHGTETRGGYVRAQLVISPEDVDSPVVEHADVFVAFSQPAYRRFYDHCDGRVLYDPEMVEDVHARSPRTPRGGTGDPALQGEVREPARREHDHAGRPHPHRRARLRGHESGHARGDPALSRAEPGRPRARPHPSRRQLPRLIPAWSSPRARAADVPGTTRGRRT